MASYLQCIQVKQWVIGLQFVCSWSRTATEIRMSTHKLTPLLNAILIGNHRKMLKHITPRCGRVCVLMEECIYRNLLFILSFIIQKGVGDSVHLE